ncbi:hypothetical protein [Sphingobium ummariense]
MIWDARKLGDLAYHRRRAWLGAFATLSWCGMLMLQLGKVQSDAADISVAVIDVIAIGYFAWMTTQEIRKARRNG